jgi:pyruvate formate lyase activating enzyme
MTGRIFDIQRFSIHDGPGIRTTVFLKGCPLRCLWCGNPESISAKPLLSYVAERCVACGECFNVCEPKALVPDPSGKAMLNRERCTVCGECAPRCDAKALEMVGRDANVQEVLEVVLRDKDYYSASGGGMTLSGGDPIFQPEFSLALLKAAKAAGIHCCMETSGYAVWGAFAPLLPFVDLWLYDYKETDPALHKKFMGETNGPIVENLRRLHEAGAKVLLRCPMIPEHNARPDHLDGIAALARQLPRLAGVELLPYYDLWRGKLKRMGLTSQLPDTVKPPSRDTVKSWNEHLRGKGVRVVGI